MADTVRFLEGAEAEASTRAMIEAFGGEEAMRAADADREAGREYLRANYGVLNALHPDETIALHRDRVVAHHADPYEFPRELDRRLEETGVSRHGLVIHYMGSAYRKLLA